MFGAGATRGCSFVASLRGRCLPPLDRDFFTQLQRVQSPKHEDLIRSVIEDVVNLFGTNFDATLEVVFATLEQMIRMVQATRETKRFKMEQLRKIRDRLLLAIAAVLEEALTKQEERRRTMRECEHMKKFVKDILAAGDTIITFNYDCVVDYHLRQYREGKWNARYGYGFRLGPRGHRLKGDSKWQPSKPATKQQTVRLLKLHGSLHFWVERPDRGDYEVTLKQRPYTYQGRGMRFTIIPPEYVKRFEVGVFRDLWNEAFRALARADKIVFIGYSLPPTDADATALFRTAVREKGLKTLVVVNPDREVRRRIRMVVQRGLTEKTRVVSLDTFEEFVNMPRDVWDVR